MELENLALWGRNLDDYRNMFLLSNQDLQSKILACDEGPSSLNFEVTKQNGNIISTDMIYQFTKDDVQQIITEISLDVREQLKANQNDFTCENIKSVYNLMDIRLTAMNDFINDYENGKKENRYVYGKLPELPFKNDTFDLVLSSHFLFLHSEQFDLQFHINAVLEMCRVAKNEVRISPLFDFKNKKSEHLEPILEILKEKGFKTKIIQNNYEFQKETNELLSILIC